MSSSFQQVLTARVSDLRGRASRCLAALLLLVAAPAAVADLDRNVDVELDADTVREALGQIASASGVRIELEGLLVDDDRSVVGRYSDVSLGYLLRQVLDGESYVIAGRDALRIRLAGGGPVSVIEGDVWLDALRAEVARTDPEAAELLDDFVADADSDEREATFDYLRSLGDGAADAWTRQAEEVLRYEKAGSRFGAADER